MVYKNTHGKRIKAAGVPQLPEHIHQHLVRGFEPTEEMEAEAARTIAVATRQMRELHLMELRDEETTEVEE